MTPSKPTILVTGGSGTFGRAFVRAMRGRARIVAMSRNAEMRYRLEQELASDDLIVAPGDVRSLNDLHDLMGLVPHVDCIIHAAAEKHVHTGQKYQNYVRDVNVGGALNVLEIAEMYRVPQVIALSTDKACEPSNYYGETKRDAERVFLRDAVFPKCTVVRYGNVIGSSGSVLPLFVKQRESGVMTVTDLRATRFFMPVSAESPWQVVQEPGRRRVMSSVELVQYAMAHGMGQDILVPSIPSGTIQNLAEEIGPACRIVETGLKSGEKLHEKLIADDEVERTYRSEGGVYRILPKPDPGLWPVGAGFRHTSDAHPQRISIEEALEAQPCHYV